MAGSLPLVESDIRKRIDTDKVMSFGSYILWMLALTVFTLGIGAIVYLVIIDYQLVDRRNQHFARQHSLFRNLLRTLREHAESKDNQQALTTIDRAEADLNEAVIREGERNPWVWAVSDPPYTDARAREHLQIVVSYSRLSAALRPPARAD